MIVNVTRPIDFLRMVAPLFGNELLQLAAIRPDGAITARGFDPNDEDAQARFVDEHGAAANLYFGLNALKQQPKKGKGSKADIGRLLMFGADFDPKSPGTREQDLAAARERLAAFRVPYTGLSDTGRGLQAVWALADGVHVNGNLAELERYSEALVKRLGADHTQDICRIFRLPGSTNHLNAKKLAQGWTPAPTRLLEWHPERRYELSDFCFLLDTASHATSRVRTATRPLPSRSEDLLAKVGSAKRTDRKRNEQIHAELDSHPHAADQADPARAVDQAIRKVEADAASLVAEVNREHALVWLQGTLCVMWMNKWEGNLPRLSKIEDIKRRWRNRMIGKINPIDEWLNSEERAEYDAIVFQPGSADVGRNFNLFQGWGVVPVRGDCSLFLEHLRVVICNRDESLFQYLLQWLANIVQAPADRPGTAVVTGSGQGAGKGSIERYLRPIFDRHLLALAGDDQLLGRFNDFMAGKLLVFADEAVWAGDKKGLDKLKSYITEPRVSVDRKFLPAIEIDNFVRFMFASNRDHAAPAESDDRRFVMLPRNDAKIGDYTYWEALTTERKAGGPAALLHHLLTEVQIKRNLRDTPKTAALAEQKLLSLDSIGQFWRAMLMEHQHNLVEGPNKDNQTRHQWNFGEVVPTMTLHRFYLAFAREHNKYRESVDALGRGLRKFVPDLSKREARVDEQRGLSIEPRTQVYEMPTLTEARAAFEAKLGHAVDWPDDDTGAM